MVLCTVVYNASTGSDSAASGSVNPTTPNTGTNGDLALSVTFTLNETVDFTASTGVADDGTDVLFVDTIAGREILFRITAFNPNPGAATTLTLATAPSTASTGRNWAVGGLRQTPDNAGGNVDILDGLAGWHFEYQAGTYTYNAASTPVILTPQNSLTEGPLTMKAASGASPAISSGDTAGIFELTTDAALDCIGLAITNTGTGTVFEDLGAAGNLRLTDCNLSSSGGFCVETEGGDLFALGCDFDGGVDIRVRGYVVLINCTLRDSPANGLDVSTSNNRLLIICIGCIFRDNGAAGAEARGTQALSNSFTFHNCIFHDNTGDGIDISTSVSALRSSDSIINCIFTENGGYGIDVVSDISGMGTLTERNNAFRNNTSGETNNITQSAADVTLTADPYTAVGSDDYTLNATAGGGAACTDAGYGYDG